MSASSLLYVSLPVFHHCCVEVCVITDICVCQKPLLYLSVSVSPLVSQSLCVTTTVCVGIYVSIAVLEHWSLCVTTAVSESLCHHFCVSIFVSPLLCQNLCVTTAVSVFLCHHCYVRIFVSPQLCRSLCVTTAICCRLMAMPASCEQRELATWRRCSSTSKEALTSTQATR